MDNTKPAPLAERLSFIETLQARAKANGISLAEVCRRANVTPQTIKNWQRELPKSLQIAEALDRVLVDIEGRSCTHSCSPGDYRKGGKCERMGCYKEAE